MKVDGRWNGCNGGRSRSDLRAETRTRQIAKHRIAVHAARQRLDAGGNVDAVVQIASVLKTRVHKRNALAHQFVTNS